MLTIPQRLALAVQHHEAGRLDQAEELYRGILQDEPQQPQALHLLGVRLHQAGRHHEALDLMQQALAAQGPEPNLHSNLAAVTLALGRLVEAEAHCREALRLNPHLPDAWCNLGITLRRKGLPVEAMQALREALRLRPHHVEAGRHLREVASAPPLPPQLAVLLARLKERVRLAPANPQLRYDLGLMLLAAGQPGPAAQHLEEALHLRSDFVEAWTSLGTARQQLGQADEAVRCYRSALRANPAHAPAHTLLGYALKSLGNTDEARAELLDAVRLAPNDSQALYFLSELAAAGAYCFPDEEMRRLAALAAQPDLPIDDRCRLHFALAQLLDRSGAYDQAFAHCRQANALRQEIDRRCGNIHDPAAQSLFADRQMAFFTQAYFDQLRSFGSDSDVPIFVVGMLRSGTTLAEQIIASHPLAHGAGELRDIGHLVVTLGQRLGGVDEYPYCLARLDPATARALADEYLQRLRQLGGSAVRVVDKFPTNFLYLGLIATLFPRARIVHCHRDPVDTCLSCYFQNFGDPLPFKLDLAHLGHYYGDYERLMAHWVRVLPLPIFELSYEELTADQEGVSRRLLAFCGLEWVERCLRFNETARAVQTASALQVRRPMYRSSVGRWRHYEAHLQPLLQALGRR